MNQDITKFVKSCDICQRTKSSTQAPYGTLNPIPPPKNKFDTYSLDFIGPLPKSPEGYDGILAIVDTFTKAVALEPIKFEYGVKEITNIFFGRIIS